MLSALQLKLGMRLASALPVALFLSLSPARAQVLEVAGSSTVAKSIVEPSQAKLREATGIELKMLSVGTGKGMQMLFDGKVKVAAVSASLDEAVDDAKKAGSVAAPAGLKLHTLLTDQLVPIVHNDNPVKELSREQLRGLLSGKLQNWKEVGGPDLAVLVVTGAPGSGTRGVLEKQLLAGQAFASGAKELRTSAAELAEVARDKAAIGYVGSGTAESAKGKIKELKAPALSRPLGLVTVGEPTPEVRKVLDYLLSTEAKKLFLQ
jgi:phosphate transport system substrate-binding protein